MKFVWLNGQYLFEDQAKISIFDRGLLFADAVYEVFLLHNGKIFDFDGHYQRLIRSLSLLKIANPTSEEQLSLIIDSLIEKNQCRTGDYAIYLQVSRGNQKPRNAIYSDNLNASSCNAFIFLSPIKIHHKLKIIKVGLSEDIRWDMATIKTNNLLANSFIISEAYKKNGYEEVILHKNGKITEATSSNLFIVKSGEIHTPKLTNAILPGTTRRQIIINIAKKLGYKVLERDIDLSELVLNHEFKKIDEIWVSSSTKLVWAINQIEDSKVNHATYPIAKSILAEILKQIDNGGG